MPMRQKIVFYRGFWWFHDPGRNLRIKLDPMFQQCGWNVGMLCKSLGIGKRTFARVIEESLGITSKLWMRQIRIVTARHLLREGEKVKTLALRLGFANDSNFTRDFKDLMGVSPSEYTKSERARAFLQIFIVESFLSLFDNLF